MNLYSAVCRTRGQIAGAYLYRTPIVVAAHLWSTWLNVTFTRSAGKPFSVRMTLTTESWQHSHNVRSESLHMRNAASRNLDGNNWFEWQNYKPLRWLARYAGNILATLMSFNWCKVNTVGDRLRLISAPLHTYNMYVTEAGKQFL